LATGFWDGPSELKSKREGDMRFEPHMDAGERAARRAVWQKAVERAKGWTE
jgi:glycerol kinase